MAQYIDKDVLVAEIERRIKSTNNDVEIGAIESLTVSKTLNSLISFIGTLKVKEVDLEKEISIWYNNRYKPIDKNFCDFEKYTGHWFENFTIIDLAKHFFELGLKTENRKENKLWQKKKQ